VRRGNDETNVTGLSSKGAHLSREIGVTGKCAQSGAKTEEKVKSSQAQEGGRVVPKSHIWVVKGVGNEAGGGKKYD